MVAPYRDRHSDAYKESLIARLASKPGLRGAIDANCVECIYDPRDSGTWRKQCEDCSCLSCPLHPVRPTTINK